MGGDIHGRGAAVEIVAPVEEELRPAFALLTHATQPEAAFVAIVTVRPEVEVIDVERLGVKESVLPLNVKVNVAGTVAETTI